MTPWHLKPEALAILARMKRPAIKHHERQYPLTTDKWAEYEGRDVNKLTALFAIHFAERDQIKPYPTGKLVFPSELLGALFGDPFGNPGTPAAWRTHLDNCEDWQAIRDEVGPALTAYIGEARQLQKARQMAEVA